MNDLGWVVIQSSILFGESTIYRIMHIIDERWDAEYLGATPTTYRWYPVPPLPASAYKQFYVPCFSQLSEEDQQRILEACLNDG